MCDHHDKPNIDRRGVLRAGLATVAAAGLAGCASERGIAGSSTALSGQASSVSQITADWPAAAAAAVGREAD